MNTRRLLWDDVLNVRDLGGLELLGGGVTRRRSVVRSSNLSRLTPSGVEEVLAFGIRMVLDLRDAAEHEIDPNPFLVKDYGRAAPTVRRLPLYSPGDPDWALMAGGKPGVLSAYREPLISVFRAIHDAPKGGIVIMCHAGRDRTGLATAILLAAAGVSEAQILADDRLSDVFLAPLYKQ
jgi:protein tyrosine/serine phosphatase